jgi:type VI secretion system ImpM family protein
LPLHGDFIRWNHNQVPEIVEFDAWLLDGMERTYEARGRAFESELRELPASCFLYTSSQTDRVLAGVLVPSQDQVGRPYPCTIGFQLDGVSPGPAFDRLPLATSALLQRALATLTGDLTGSTLPVFLERVQALAADLDENVAEQELRRYLFGTTLEQLFGEWPGFVPPARRAQFAHELRRLSGPPFPPRYVVALPCRGRAGEVAFWLSLLRQWLPVRRNPSLVFWPARPDGTGTLRLLFDEPGPRYFVPTVWARQETSNLLDLGRSLATRTEAGEGAQAGLLRPRALLQDVILAASRELPGREPPAAISRRECRACPAGDDGLTPSRKNVGNRALPR